MTEKILSVKNLSREFISESGERTSVITDISFSVDAGDFVCILGPSGCGKTTLLRAVSGLIEPTSGEILINGRPVKGKTAEVGFVFQEGPLFPWRTALDNAVFGLEVRGIPREQRTGSAREALSLVGLETQDHGKRPYELSGGMQQRVAIAQALCPNPEILLLDEPFSGLDEVTSWRLQEELVRIWKSSKKTIVFVTHVIEDAVFMGERVIITGGKPGRIIEDIEINLPYPRERTTENFTDRLLEVRKLFHDASKPFFNNKF